MDTEVKTQITWEVAREQAMAELPGRPMSQITERAREIMTTKDPEVRTQKWTQGPWKLHDTWPDDVVDDTGALVVSAYGDYESPQTQANALLISKAPQMADLLRDGKQIVEGAVTHVTHGGPTISEALEWIRKADVLLSALEKIGGTK